MDICSSTTFLIQAGVTNKALHHTKVPNLPSTAAAKGCEEMQARAYSFLFLCPQGPLTWGSAEQKTLWLINTKYWSVSRNLVLALINGYNCTVWLSTRKFPSYSGKRTIANPNSFLQGWRFTKYSRPHASLKLLMVVEHSVVSHATPSYV